MFCIHTELKKKFQWSKIKLFPGRGLLRDPKYKHGCAFPDAHSVGRALYLYVCRAYYPAASSFWNACKETMT